MTNHPHALPTASIGLREGRPQTVPVQSEAVELGLLATAAGHDRPALVMHLQHQFRCLVARVSEEFLEHESHVRHEVDRVVPHDDEPHAVEVGLSLVLDVFDRVGRGRLWHGENRRTDS